LMAGKGGVAVLSPLRREKRGALFSQGKGGGGGGGGVAISFTGERALR